MLQEAGHIKNAVVFISRHIQFLNLMNPKLTLLLIPLEIKVQPQIILVQTTFQAIFPFVMTMAEPTGNLIDNKMANRITKKFKNSQQNNSGTITNEHDKKIP